MSRIATFVIGVLAVILGLMFESQNIAFLSGLVLAIAASVNFPVLFLSMFWKGLTTRGAVAGSVVGLVSAVAMLVLSPVVWAIPHPLCPAFEDIVTGAVVARFGPRSNVLNEVEGFEGVGSTQR